MLIVRYRSEGALGTKGIRCRWGGTLSFPCKWSELLWVCLGSWRGGKDGGGVQREPFLKTQCLFFLSLLKFKSFLKLVFKIQVWE